MKTLSKHYQPYHFLFHWTLYGGIALIFTHLFLLDAFRMRASTPFGVFPKSIELPQLLVTTFIGCVIIGAVQLAQISGQLRLEIPYWTIASGIGGAVGAVVWAVVVFLFFAQAQGKFTILLGFVLVWLGMSMAQSFLLRGYLARARQWWLVVAGCLTMFVVTILRHDYPSFYMTFEFFGVLFAFMLASGLGLLVLLERNTLETAEQHPHKPSVWDNAV